MKSKDRVQAFDKANPIIPNQAEILLWDAHCREFKHLIRLNTAAPDTIVRCEFNEHTQSWYVDVSSGTTFQPRAAALCELLGVKPDVPQVCVSRSASFEVTMSLETIVSTVKYLQKTVREELEVLLKAYTQHKTKKPDKN